MNLSTPRMAVLAAAIACAAAANAQQAPQAPMQAPTQAPTQAPMTPRTMPSQTMDAQAYAAEQERIKADYKAAKAACERLSGNAQDVCEEEAKGKEKVATAELRYQRSGAPEDASRVALAKADAAYEVAKERCDDLKGDAKVACVKEAKAAEARAKADAKAKM